MLRRALVNSLCTVLAPDRRGHGGGLPGGEPALPELVLPQIPAQLTL